MQTALIEVPKGVALMKFREYREQVRRRHTKEDETLMRGFKALAKGKKVISMSQTLKKGGLDDRFFPNIAVVRADSPECFCRIHRNGAVEFKMDRGWIDDRATRRYVRFPEKTLSGWLNGEGWYEASSKVPVVPPSLRPYGALSNYHILWEANWKLEPPVDPYLLKRIGSDVFVVLAEWDLTELERAVMR